MPQTFQSNPRSQLLANHLMLMKHSLVSIYSPLLRINNSNLILKGSKENTKKKGSKPDQTLANTAVIVGKDELRDIRTKTEKGQKSDAIVISKTELERMKESTKI